jgi:hypothetical protein
MTSRRTFLLAGTAGAAALTVAWRLRGTPERAAAPGAGASLAALDPAAPAIVAALVPVMLAGALPEDAAAREGAVRETAANVGRAIGGLPPAAQKEMAELFALLGLPATRIALAGIGTPWEEAPPAAVAAFLERWRTSRFMLLRSAYDALHQLVIAAWYGNPNAWKAIGYPGPPQV